MADIPPGNIALLVAALREYGKKAVAGDQNNPAIIEYFTQAGHPEIKSDETPWCAAFLTAMARRSGLIASPSLSARSWLAFGEKVDTPTLGDVAIFWRNSPDGNLGHVGIYIAEQGTNILILGGNESNQVQIDAFPSRRLLGFRRLN